METEKSATNQPVIAEQELQAKQVQETQAQQGQEQQQQPQQQGSQYQQPQYQQPQQPQYQQPAYQQNAQYSQQFAPQYVPSQYDYATQQPTKDLSTPMTTWRWLLTLLVMCVPIVNIVMIFVWAFGSNVNISKRSYFRAALLLALIITALFTGLYIAFGAVVYQTILDLFAITVETY